MSMIIEVLYLVGISSFIYRLINTVFERYEYVNEARVKARIKVFSIIVIVFFILLMENRVMFPQV